MPYTHIQEYVQIRKYAHYAITYVSVHLKYWMGRTVTTLLWYLIETDRQTDRQRQRQTVVCADVSLSQKGQDVSFISFFILNTRGTPCALRMCFLLDAVGFFSASIVLHALRFVNLAFAGNPELPIFGILREKSYKDGVTGCILTVWLFDIIIHSTISNDNNQRKKRVERKVSTAKHEWVKADRPRQESWPVLIWFYLWNLMRATNGFVSWLANKQTNEQTNKQTNRQTKGCCCPTTQLLKRTFLREKD